MGGGEVMAKPTANWRNSPKRLPPLETSARYLQKRRAKRQSYAL